MKVLDPQAGLLTIGEVYEFLKSSKTRPADRKIGAYDSVNLQNYDVVRSDLNAYIKTTTPHVVAQPPLQTWVKNLVQKLKKYELTKTEVYSLINLGVGQNAVSITSRGNNVDSEVETNGDTDEAKPEAGQNVEDGAEEEVELADDSGLDRMLFGLVVEEADDRFAGDEGEERIAEVLDILKEFAGDAGTKSNAKIVNGD